MIETCDEVREATVFWNARDSSMELRAIDVTALSLVQIFGKHKLFSWSWYQDLKQCSLTETSC